MIDIKKLLNNVKNNDMSYPLLGKLAVLGDCSTQYMSLSFQGYAKEKGYCLDVYDLGYDQIELQLLDIQSELHSYKADYILIYMCTEKLYEKFCYTDFNEKSRFAEMQYEVIRKNWILEDEIGKSIIIQTVFPEIDDRVFGNYAGKTKNSFIYQLRKLNLLLMEESQRYKNVYLLELPYIQNMIGRNYFYNSVAYYASRMSCSLESIPYIAKQVIDIITSLKGIIIKCIVLDLDNTIWGGTIGEDGIEGIQIGELGIGRVFKDFQLWLKELKNKGILLAVCSKNDEEIAKKPFIQHPDMILKLTDISLFVANWNNKAENIKSIQKTLNIGMDSIVFIDDNPFERRSVKEMLPEIIVPELPDDPALYLTFLKEENLFETVSFSKEDGIRTLQYQAEIIRNDMLKKFESFDLYLKSLLMKGEMKEFDQFSYPRIAQLMQRTNQFNVRTIRFTERELVKLANDPNYLCFYFTLKDKFGDYGIVSALILEKLDSYTLSIVNWVMSCRVLKRGMEEYVINKLVELSAQMKIERIISEYVRTKKNQLIAQSYERLGFTMIGIDMYEILVNAFQTNITFVEE